MEVQMPLPGALVRFVPAEGAPGSYERIAHAWDSDSAEYVPIPWGKAAVVLGVDPTDDAWNWVEVLTEGRVLLALLEDLVVEEAQ